MCSQLRMLKGETIAPSEMMVMELTLKVTGPPFTSGSFSPHCLSLFHTKTFACIFFSLEVCHLLPRFLLLIFLHSISIKILDGNSTQIGCSVNLFPLAILCKGSLYYLQFLPLLIKKTADSVSSAINGMTTFWLLGVEGIDFNPWRNINARRYAADTAQFRLSNNCRR